MSDMTGQTSGDEGRKKNWLPERAARMARWGIGIIFFTLLFGIIGLPIPEIILGGAFLIAAGWIYFLIRVIPELEWNLSMIASSLIVLTIAVIGFHAIARRLRDGWQFRWTAACTGLGGALFAAAIAVTGIFHQGVWLAKGDIFSYRGGISSVVSNMSNARQLVLALNTFETESDHYPESIYELYPDYIDIDPGEDEYFWSFVDDQKKPHEWLYFPEVQNLLTGQSTAVESARRVILASPVDINGRYVVAFFDGHVAAVKREQYLKLLATRQEELLRDDKNENGEQEASPSRDRQ